MINYSQQKQIETLYVTSSYNDVSPSKFAILIMELFGKDVRETRSNLQSRARWKYLTMIANILNGTGQTYTPNGTDMQIKWTKDLLYEIYWQSIRHTMYPKKGKQLNTKEFSDLVEMVMALFAQIFDISISFPNFQDQVKPEEPKF